MTFLVEVFLISPIEFTVVFPRGGDPKVVLNELVDVGEDLGRFDFGCKDTRGQHVC